jgi:hypothetical protein
MPAHKQTEHPEPKVYLPTLGVVPAALAKDQGILALERMVRSITIIDGQACWDYMFMFEVRDALCKTAQSRQTAFEEVAVLLTNDSHRIQRLQKRMGYDVNRAKTIAKLRNLTKLIRKMK